MGIGSHGSSLSLCQHIIDIGLILGGGQPILLAVVLKIIIAILINTLILESIDRTECCSDGYALYIRATAGSLPFLV